MKHLVVGLMLMGLASAGLLAVAPAAVRGEMAIAAQQDVPTGETSLGTVRIPRSVLADGKPLPAGTYQVRLTPDPAKPEVPGQLPELSRWVEFVQQGEVRGREVVTIIPQAEIAQIAQTTPPRAGTSRVDLLRGGDYWRVWINRAGNHFLIHMPPA